MTTRAFFQEQYSSGTGVGAGTASTYNKRALNTEVINQIPGCTFNSATNEVTLLAGSYWVRARAPAINYTGHLLSLYDFGGSSVLIGGSSEVNGVASGGPLSSLVSNPSFVEGPLVLTTTTTIGLNHYLGAAAVSGASMGNPASTGSNEVFSTLNIELL